MFAFLSFVMMPGNDTNVKSNACQKKTNKGAKKKKGRHERDESMERMTDRRNELLIIGWIVAVSQALLHIPTPKWEEKAK